MMDRIVFVLVQDKNGIKYRFFWSEKMARETAGLRPSYPRACLHSNQGGTLWTLVPGRAWEIIEDIPGEYNVARRGLYDTEGHVIL